MTRRRSVHDLRQPIPTIPAGPSPSSPSSSEDAGGPAISCGKCGFWPHDQFCEDVYQEIQDASYGGAWRPARDVDGLAPAFKPGPTHTRPAQVIRGAK